MEIQPARATMVGMGTPDYLAYSIGLVLITVIVVVV
jgi:hypothetical protein